MEKEIVVGVGTYHVAKNPKKLICIGLGSCLAIAIHAPMQHIGALSHAMLPKYMEGKDKVIPEKYVDTSIYLMVDDMQAMGVKKSAMKAKLVGGAQMFSFISPHALDIGRRNIETAKVTLKEEKIPILAEDVGGNKGKTISFDIKSGRILVCVQGQKKKVI
jgi:chemotaxis protein CheD